MTTAISSMSEYVHYVDQERKEQWSALATIRGHSFPNCMENNGEKKSYKLLDAQGKQLQDKNGKPVEILSAHIGLKSSFTACLKTKGGINTPLTQLTGPGKEAIEWYFNYLNEKYRQNRIKLDAGGEGYVYKACTFYVPRRIMWNKHDAYIGGDKTAFAGDKDVHRYMLAIVLENDIQDAATEVGIGAANRKIESFIKKHISQVIDTALHDEWKSELEEISKSLNEEVPTAIDQFLSEWSKKYLLPEILKSQIRVLKSGSEDEDE